MGCNIQDAEIFRIVQGTSSAKSIVREEPYPVTALPQGQGTASSFY
jgi:hypothetical protein